MTAKKSRLLRFCLIGGAGLATAALSFADLGHDPVTTAQVQELSDPAELPPSGPAPPFPGFWESLRVPGDEAEGNAALSEMAGRGA